MAGTVKKLQFSEGTNVGAPTDLGIATSTTVIEPYADDAAYVTANGTATEGDVYLNTTTKKFRCYISGAWRNAVMEADGSDATKLFLVDVSGNTTGTTATLDFNVTANRVYTFPDYTATMASLAGSETLSNKTLASPLVSGGSIDVSVAGNLSVGGSVGANNLTLGGASTTVVVPGNLNVQGTTTTIDTATLEVEDANIVVNNGGNDASSEGAGLTVERTGTSGSLIYANAATSKWKAGALGSEVEIADISSSQTLSNKIIANTSTITVQDANLTIQDNLDNTKQAKIQASGITAGQTRTMTVPDADITLVGTDNAQTIQNKTLDNTNTVTVKDTLFTIQDDGDATKQAKFQASGITTGTTRTFTLPDANTTVVGTDATQVITAKDIDGGTASNTSRITLPKAAKATLDGLTRKEGTVVYASDLDKPYYDDGTILREIGAGGGGGGINYVSNDDFEDNNVTGWATYFDAAAITPVNGTGGSPTVTFAASSSSPLRGTYSGLFTKDAANRQGEGFSYDFTIASADKSRPLLVTWEGEASANYTGSSGTEYLAVYLYDVTNSTLISPASTTVAPGTSKGSTFFVATTSTSYRLIFHVAGTGTAAWTYKIDTVSVGPQSIAMGPALTDWQSWTPTFNGFGTTANVAMYWRRSGDTMEIAGSFKAGTVTASSGYFTIPNSLTLDTSKVPAIGRGVAGVAILQTGGATDIGATGTLAAVLYDTTNTGNLYFDNDQAASGSDPFAAKNGSSVLANNCFVTLPLVRVYISQWASSNYQTADRAVEEFASNSSSTDASDTSSFAYGLSGSTGIFGTTALSAGRAKRVRFTQPIQDTDRIEIEIYDGLRWQPVTSNSQGTFGYVIQNTTDYGMYWQKVAGNTTDIDVQFARYAVPTGATYGSAGAAWNSAFSGYKWRVRKTSGGASVGYPVGSQNIVGRVDGVAPSTGYVGELISSNGTSTTVNTSMTNLGSVALTAGEWDIRGQLDIGSPGANNYINLCIGTTSASTSGTTRGYDNMYFALASNGGGGCVSRQVRITSTTTYYLNANVGASASASGAWIIYARRIA